MNEPSEGFIYFICGVALLISFGAILFGFFGGELHGQCIAFCR